MTSSLSFRVIKSTVIAGAVCLLPGLCCMPAYASSLLSDGRSMHISEALSSHSSQNDGRCVGCQHDERVLERWAWKYYPDSYAGMYFTSRRGNRFVIGFTERQSSRVHAARRLPGLLGRPHVSGFPHVPKHSLSELNELQQRILDDVVRNEAYSGLITSVGVVVQVNLVEVGAPRGHVEKARELLKKLYGPDAPIRVHYEEPPAEV